MSNADGVFGQGTRQGNDNFKEEVSTEHKLKLYDTRLRYFLSDNYDDDGDKNNGDVEEARDDVENDTFCHNNDDQM